MQKMNKILVAVSLLCASIASASAQTNTQTEVNNVVPQYDYNPSWYVAPSLGWMDADQGFKLNGHGQAAAIRFGKSVSADWDLQFGTSYGRQSGKLNNYRQNTLGVDALYMLSRSNFRPYLSIGAGVQEDKLVTASARVAKTSPYLSAGLGMQIGLTEQLALNLDLRRVHGLVNHDSGINSFGLRRTNNNYFTIGLAYSFDAPPKRPIVQAPMPVADTTPLVITETRPVPVVAAPMPAPAVFEKLTLSATELFGFDSTKLLGQQTKLDSIANVLVSTPQSTPIMISGYADRLGSDKYNQRLSQDRADVVRNYLIERGVASSSLTAQGRGESNPVVDCHQKKRAELILCLEPNRRVELEQTTIERRVK
jgi:OOP family OmpA-OmpF porin